MTTKFSRFLQPSRGAVAEIASLVPGLTFRDSFRGALRCGSRSATVILEGDEWLRVTLPSSWDKSPEDALRTTGAFPGNARFALGPSGAQLVADSRLDGRDHLPASLGELRPVLRNGGKAPRAHRARREEALRREEVQSALSDPSWAGGDVVSLEQGWEVRPTLGGQPAPVRLSTTEHSLCVQRVVSTRWPNDLRGRAAALEALRLNTVFRLARLALHDSTLCVESRLHRGLICPGWLAVAVRAVAVAFEHAHKSLQVLLDDTHVSESYLRVLSR